MEREIMVMPSKTFKVIDSINKEVIKQNRKLSCWSTDTDYKNGVVNIF